MSEENKPAPRRRRKNLVSAEVVAPATVDDSAMIERIRGGEWKSVLSEVGSVEYNRLRLLALK